MPFAATRVTGPGATIDHTPEADVAAGEVVVVGTRVGIATSPIAADALGSLARDGVWKLYKDPDDQDVFADGDPVYVNAEGQKATDDNGDSFFGFSVGAVEADDDYVIAELVSPGAPAVG